VSTHDEWSNAVPQNALLPPGRNLNVAPPDDLAEAVAHTYRHCLSGTYNVAPDSGVQEEIAGALAGGSAMLPLPATWRSALSDWRWRLWRSGSPPGARAYAEHSWVIAGDKLRMTGWEPSTTPNKHWW